MKRPHLLRVEAPPAAFAPLAAAAADHGLRLGWLMLEPPAVPAPLEAAAALGVLRAVAVGGGRSLAAKPMRGAPVLDDLLREHFRGCRLVLVAGEVEAPALAPEAGGWRLTGVDGSTRRLRTEALLAALRRPRPWD